MMTFAQTTMYINKYDNTTDSVNVSQIKSITFKSADTTTLTQGLVLYYQLNGNAIDSSGNHYNGIVYGATPTKNRFGIDSSAMSFNGSGNFIRVGDILDDVFSVSAAKFSISGWAKTNVPGSVASGGGLIIGKTGGGIGPYQWAMAHYSDKTVHGHVASDSLFTNGTSVMSSTAEMNEWFHFVFVFDGGLPINERIKIYINTELKNTFELQKGILGTHTANTSQEICIGGQHLPGDSSTPSIPTYNGSIDEIRIYNQALSLTEINALYWSEN